MKETMSKIMKWKPSTKLIAILALLALAVILIPLVRVAFYAVPWYDDYNYGGFAKRFWEQEATLGSLWNGLINCVKTQWYAWQGTFSSIFFMTLMPAIWGEDKYCIGSLCLIALLVIAIFVLVKVLVKDVFRLDWSTCVLMQAVTAIMTVLLIHRSQLAFYWYNAAVHYVGMHSVCILLVAASIRLLQVRKLAGRIALTLATMLGALIVSGSNYITSLQGAVLLASTAVVGCLVYGKKWMRVLWLLPAVLVYGIGFYMNVTAPGNAVRAANFEGWGYGPVESVLRSFLEAAKHIGPFTGWFTVVIMVLLAPFIWQAVSRTDFVFRMPGLVLLWSVCMYATGFTSSLYSLGHAGISRAMNVVRLTYQILLILNEIYWLGWLHGYLMKREKKMPAGRMSWWFYPIIGVLMLVIFCIEPDKVGTYSTYAAFHAVHSGEAYNFYQQYQERVTALKGEESVVTFEPYRYKPWVICAGDLSEDPNKAENVAIANWYGKEAVICKTE